MSMIHWAEMYNTPQYCTVEYNDTSAIAIVVLPASHVPYCVEHSFSKYRRMLKIKIVSISL